MQGPDAKVLEVGILFFEKSAVIEGWRNALLGAQILAICFSHDRLALVELFLYHFSK